MGKQPKRKAVGKPGRKPVAKGRLDALGIGWVCERIVERKSMTDISVEAGVGIATFIAWIDGDPERSARAREARERTAMMWDEQATREIEMATDALSLAKAKELAHHYRWRASKIAPRSYGERVEVNPDPARPMNVAANVTMDPMEAYRLMKNGGI